MVYRHDDELENLRAQVAYLRQELGMVRDLEMRDAVRRRWNFTAREADVVLALYAARHHTLTKSALMANLANPPDDDLDIKVADVFIHRIRKKAGYGFVETVPVGGLRLGPSAIEACRHAIDAALAA